MIKRTHVMVALLIIFILLLTGVIWLNTISRPVIWSYKEKGEISRLPTFVIFNPFRDKKTEAESDRILQSIKDGRCSELVAELGSSDRHRSLCANLTEDGLIEWKLVFREDNVNTVNLFYSTKRVSSDTYDDELLVSFDIGSEQARLTNIGPIH